MLKRNLFFGRAPIFFAADDGAKGNGGASPAQPTTLADARKRISQLEADAAGHATTVSTLTTERDEARTQRDQNLEVATTNARERDEARNDRDNARTERDTAQRELATERTARGKADENVTRLEKLCGLRGINQNELPTAADDTDANSGATLYAEWQNLSGAAKTAFRRKHEQALNQYADSLNRKK